MSEAEVRSGVEQPDLTPPFRPGYKIAATEFSRSENTTERDLPSRGCGSRRPPRLAHTAIERQPL